MVSVIVQHHVADYDRWLPVYEEHGEVRRRHGGTGHEIFREVADPGSLVVVNEFETLDGARAFAQDPSLPAAMERAGVDSTPLVWIVESSEARRY
jgi:uncharacterized protein (DUF1330 family)